MTKAGSNVFHRAIGLVKHGWLQDKIARTADGRVCLPDNPAAACWCASGAILAAACDDNNELRLAEKCLAKHFECRQRMVFHRLATFNDTPGRTQAEVISLLQKLAKDFDAEKADGKDETA